MPTITLIRTDGSKTEITTETGWSLMEILRDNNIEKIEGVCGGSMACATCHIYIHPDWQNKINAQNDEKTDEEDDMLDLAFDVTDNSRLGCQIRMSDALDGLTVALPGTKTNW